MRALFLAVVAICAAAQQPQQARYTIAGTVVDHLSGRPLAGILMSIAPVGDNSEPLVMLTAADGRFSFPNLLAAKYSLTAQRRGSPPQQYLQHGNYSTAIVTGPGLDSEHISFPLTALARLTGTVMDSEGDPVPDAHVTLVQQGVTNGLLQLVQSTQAQTSQSGAFHFSNLQPSRYYVVVQGRPWYAQPNLMGQPNAPPSELDVAYAITYSGDTADPAAAQPVQLAEGGIADVRITMHAVPAVHLSLKLPEEPNTGFGVSLFAHALNGLALQDGGGMTVTQGVMRLSGVAPGRYEFVAGSDQSRIQKMLDLTADTTLELSKETAAQGTGRVTVEDSGSGAHMEVVLHSNNGNYVGNSVGGGALSFPAVPAGRYQVSLFNSPGRYYIKSISFNGRKMAGDFIDVPSSGGFDVSVVVARFGIDKLEGIVQQDGKGVPAAMVLLIPEDLSRVSLIRRDQSDSDGSFSLPQIAPGKYTLLAIDADEDFAYADLAVIKPYLARGKVVTIASGFNQRLIAPLISRQQ